MSVYGGIETGGSKWKCAVGTDPDSGPRHGDDPDDDARGDDRERDRVLRARGPGGRDRHRSFGPVDQKLASPTWGYITTTPKPGWAHTDVGQEIQRRLSVPVAFDTDVNAAALGEHRWGVAQGLDTFCYITIGTGIGGGGMARGKLLHGLVHPEFGHMRIPHDQEADPLPVSARTTATAGRGSPRRGRSRPAGVARPRSCRAGRRSGSSRRTTSPSAWSP